MFGIYRYVLALMVVYTHAWGRFADGTNWAGTYAVFAFYVLSGFLMTLVLQTRYGHSRRGLERYFANRFLRIYPVYWAVLASGAFIAWYDPAATFRGSPFLTWPPDAAAWLANVFIVGLHTFKTRLVPAAWTLSVEVIYYVAMGLVFSRSRALTMGWLAASIAVSLVAVTSGAGFGELVSSVWGASLPFSLGAAVCFLPRRKVPGVALPLVAGLFLANTHFANALWRDLPVAGVYASTLLSVVLVYLLRDVDPGKGRLARVEQFAGDLAYPMFLSHPVVFAYLVVFAFGGIKPEPATLLVVCLVPVHLAAIVFHQLVEARIEPLRHRLRPR